MTYSKTMYVHNLYICNMELLNEKIKKLRIQKNISQVDMANAAGMSRGAFIAFENGKESVNLSLRAAIEIAKALDVSFNELFEIEAPAVQDEKSQKFLVFHALEVYVSNRVFSSGIQLDDELSPEQEFLKHTEYVNHLREFKRGMYETLVLVGFCTQEDITEYKKYINDKEV